MSYLILCKTCAAEISADARRCPACGQPDPRPSNKSGCFIATSVFGDYNHSVVRDLRKFRDNWLYKREFGKRFIIWYYEEGPKLALWVGKSKTRKKICYALIVNPLHLVVKFFNLHS